MKQTLFFLFLVLLVSCRKDQDVCKISGHTLTTSSTNLVIGDATAADVVVYGVEHVILEEDATSYSQCIDLFNDCTIDIRLTKDKTTGEESIYLNGSSDILFLDELVPFISYSYTEHTYYDFSGGVEHYATHYKTNILPAIQIDFTENYLEQAPHYFQPEEIFSGCPNYSISHRLLLRKNTTGNSAFVQSGSVNDTLLFESTAYAWDYYFPPPNEKRYIAFSYSSELGMKYGWIKLASSGAQEFSILEYALQK